MFSTYPYPKTTVGKSSCGPDTAINGTVPSIYYAYWPNIAESLATIKIYTMSLFAFPLALYTVFANEVSGLSIINVSGGREGGS